MEATAATAPSAAASCAARVCCALANEVVDSLRPTETSERNRTNTVSYMRRLLELAVGEGGEVAMFGSVPLRTYLPDGDIDICLVGSNELLARDGWTERVRALLEARPHGAPAELPVTEVQIIHAEVKVMKCMVGGVVVDISANTLGGLATFAFLEQVDRHIGRCHLFKRSIILVKAWCYYEGRILGAHHGLFSTYAVETLVLYLFNVFNSRLQCTFDVLQLFLETFSKFDWEQYAVSIRGPVLLAKLPAMEYQTPQVEGGTLLSEDFLAEALRDCAVPPAVGTGSGPSAAAAEPRPFPAKFTNVVDPLLPSNNLGRSVSHASFLRIKKALALGHRSMTAITQAVSEEECAILFRAFFRKLRSALQSLAHAGAESHQGEAGDAYEVHEPAPGRVHCAAHCLLQRGRHFCAGGGQRPNVHRARDQPVGRGGMEHRVVDGSRGDSLAWPKFRHGPVAAPRRRRHAAVARHVAGSWAAVSGRSLRAHVSLSVAAAFHGAPTQQGAAFASRPRSSVLGRGPAGLGAERGDSAARDAPCPRGGGGRLCSVSASPVHARRHGALRVSPRAGAVAAAVAARLSLGAAQPRLGCRHPALPRHPACCLRPPGPLLP